jgi:hypothetical protein
MDWLADLGRDGGEDLVRRALAAVANADRATYLEAPECQVAVAAAEAVAAARGAALTDSPQEIVEWAARHPTLTADLSALAVAAVDRILVASELKDLWDETEPEAWRASMMALVTRLR